MWNRIVRGLATFCVLVTLVGAHTHTEHEEAHHHHHHDHHHHRHHHHDESDHDPAALAFLLQGGESAKAFACTAVISILPTLIIPFIPMTTSDANGVAILNENVHKMLLSFAAGGLLGEVFLHSLPHLLERHDHFSHADHAGHPHTVKLEEGEALCVSVWLLAGFLLFFISEKLVKAVLGNAGHSHSHGHGHGVSMQKEMHHSDDEGEEEEEEDDGQEDDSGVVNSRGLRRRSPRIRERQSPQERRGKTAAAAAAGGRNGKRQQGGLSLKERQAGGGWGALKAGAYLNITLDMLHNLTDGVAIGASFASGHGVGVATTLSILLHEVPHELGDFAILVQSGLSLRNAFLMQFATAIAAFVGTAVGLVSKRHEGFERLLLALTTGGFLYVAAVSVLPELLTGNASFSQSLREVAGVIMGIALMAWVAMGEHAAH